MAGLPNTEMAAAWDGEQGAHWAAHWERYDRAIAGFHRRLLGAAAIGPDDAVLDVGCGNGKTTRAAARSATAGSALGVDLSGPMLDRARQLAASEGIDNVRFEQADVQVHPFPPGQFDVAISGFGVMFFDDPVAAFTNMAAAIAPAGRLVFVAWQELARNQWVGVVRESLAAGRDLPPPPAGMPGPFGLADPDRTTSILDASGFEEIVLETVDEPFWVGRDASDAFAFLQGTGPARGLLEGLDADARAEGLAKLEVAMVAHDGPEGVRVGAAAWLVTARRGDTGMP